MTAATVTSAAASSYETAVQIPSQSHNPARIAVPGMSSCMADDRKWISVLGRHRMDDERLRFRVDRVVNLLRPLRFAVEHHGDFSLVGVDVSRAWSLVADLDCQRTTPLERLDVGGDFVALMNVEASCHMD